jgi:hypothetical protein
MRWILLSWLAGCTADPVETGSPHTHTDGATDTGTPAPAREGATDGGTWWVSYAPRAPTPSRSTGVSTS